MGRRMVRVMKMRREVRFMMMMGFSSWKKCFMVVCILVLKYLFILERVFFRLLVFLLMVSMCMMRGGKVFMVVVMVVRCLLFLTFLWM